MADYYTVSRLAEFVGVSERTIERWYAGGILPEPELRAEHGTKLWSPEQAREVLARRIRNSPGERARRRRIP